MEYTLRPALVKDMKQVHALLLESATAGEMLPRSLSNLYSHTQDFVLIKGEGGTVAGCCALALIWDNLAEIRSLFVRQDLRRQGWGHRLVEACLEKARSLGVSRVFTLTYQVNFFSTLSFMEIDMSTLSHKVWVDCVHCPKFPDNCDETAMQRDI